MTTMGVVFAVINLIAVILLIIKFRGTPVTSAPTLGDLPSWAENQIEELKDALGTKESELEKAKSALTDLQVQSAQQVSSLKPTSKLPK